MELARERPLRRGYFPFASSLGSPAALSYAPSVDRGGGAGSGSLQIVVDPFGLAMASATACITKVTAAKAYYSIAETRFAPGETGIGTAQVTFRAFASKDCSSASLAVFPMDSVSTSDGRGVWLHKNEGTIASSPDTVPAGTKSVEVEVELQRSTTTGVITLNVDNVFFAPVELPTCASKTPTIGGTDAADFIIGTSGPDIIIGFGGNDTLSGGESNDTICAGTGADTVFGGGGKDLLLGQQGNDHLYGGEGNDKLKGGPGSRHPRGRGQRQGPTRSKTQCVNRKPPSPVRLPPTAESSAVRFSIGSLVDRSIADVVGVASHIGDFHDADGQRLSGPH